MSLRARPRTATGTHGWGFAETLLQHNRIQGLRSVSRVSRSFFGGVRWKDYNREPILGQ
jgi:hypothetical protein